MWAFLFVVCVFVTQVNSIIEGPSSCEYGSDTGIDYYYWCILGTEGVAVYDFQSTPSRPNATGSYLSLIYEGAVFRRCSINLIVPDRACTEFNGTKYSINFPCIVRGELWAIMKLFCVDDLLWAQATLFPPTKRAIK